MLAIENHDRFPAERLAGIVESIGSPQVGICLDTVNSFGCLEGPEHVAAHLAPFVSSLHVKDFTIRRAGHMMGFEITGTPAGQGMLDIPGSSTRCARPAAIRMQFSNCGRLRRPPCPDIGKEEEWGLASVRYLRTLIAD